MACMRARIQIRELTEDERKRLEGGLRSSESFVMRRSQILLASARGAHVPQIAQALSCDEQTVRNALHAFNATGVAALHRPSSRPVQTREAFDDAAAEQLQALLHRSPRDYDKPTSLWTLALAAEVSYEQKLTAHLVSHETIRRTLQRLGWSWKRAKQWITSPDPAYTAKKKTGSADRPGRGAGGLGAQLQ